MDRNNRPNGQKNINRVALRKESVDRNYQANAVDQILPVALRKESVDRNFYYSDKDADWVRRSPQGERG